MVYRSSIRQLAKRVEVGRTVKRNTLVERKALAIFDFERDIDKVFVE